MIFLWKKSTKAIGLISSIFIAANSLNNKVSAQGLGGTLRFSTYQRDCLNIDDVNHKKVLKSVTVGIETAAGSGSGVVIGKKGNVWVALTAKHVYKGSNSNEIKVYSPVSKQYYEVLDTASIAEKDIDIGIVKFKSDDDLPIAILNFNLLTTSSPSQRPAGKQWGVLFDGGMGAGVSMPSGAVTVPVLRYTSFNLQERAEGNLNGYEFLYQASTVPGMSGGPILGYRAMNPKNPNDIVRSVLPVGLIAIHGRSEDYISGGRSGMSLAVPIDMAKNYLTKNADNLGIPMGYTQIENLLRKQYCK